MKVDKFEIIERRERARSSSVARYHLSCEGVDGGNRVTSHTRVRRIVHARFNASRLLLITTRLCRGDGDIARKPGNLCMRRGVLSELKYKLANKL